MKLCQTKPTLNAHNEQLSNNETNEIETNNEPKRNYLLNQIQALLNELTNMSSTALNGVASMQETKSSNETNNKFNFNATNTSKNANGYQIDPKSVADFRSQTFLCGDCYGDLFIV